MTSRSPSSFSGENSPPEIRGMKRLITVKQLAEICTVSPRHIYRLLDKGQLPEPFKLGGAVRWDYDVICRWLENGAPSNWHAYQGSHRSNPIS